jgi:hypothetical protein
VPIQSWVHHWDVGAGKKVLRILVALLGFAALASLYDLFSYESYSGAEAMEVAQLARNVSEGRGYTTDSIRPLALYYLQNAAEPGQSSKVLAQRVPDLSNPPAYPLILAGLMKALPFRFVANQYWTYGPELWVSIFNQALYFAAVIVLFFLARKLFDPLVAWLTAILFAGSELYWKFSISGLSTIWVILVFLVMVSFMTAIGRRERGATEETAGKSTLLAIATGLLAGLGTLSRYSFAWLMLPLLLYIWTSVRRGRLKLCGVITLTFLVVVGPWVARNILVSGHCFGTADYALLQGTPPLPADTLERSSNPRSRLHRLTPSDVANKFVANAQAMLGNELPRIGGNWISAFFLAGLFIAFRNPALARFRWFVVGSLLLLFFAEALQRTHLSSDVPDVNSENLLAIVAPLLFMFGAALFYTFLEQLNLSLPELRGLVVTCFVILLCAPYLLALTVPRGAPVNSPYSPRHIHQVTGWVRTNDLMISDIPAAVAWYGERSCVWLPLDDENEFYKVNALKPVKGLFLTQVTTDKRFLSEMKEDPKSWGNFVLECSEHQEVPSGFPLRKSPVGLLPEQMFLSDDASWRVYKTNP